MFRFLQRRPQRGIVFKLGEDDKFRWRAVDFKANFDDEDKQWCQVADHRTVFTDTIQDGYHSVKQCFADAVHEVERWCPRNKVSWWLESSDILLRCRLQGDDLVLPNQDETQGK